MLYTKEHILDYLTANNIVHKLFEHAPLFTCEQAREIVAHMNMPGAGIKNLFLKDSRKKLYLISAIDQTRIDLKTVGKTIDAKELRFADATLLMQHLGVQPGSVTPLALINDIALAVQPILDAEILKQEYIQIHPLKNDATVVITPDDLLTFLSSINREYIVYDFVKNEVVPPCKKCL